METGKDLVFNPHINVKSRDLKLEPLEQRAAAYMMSKQIAIQGAEIEKAAREEMAYRACSFKPQINKPRRGASPSPDMFLFDSKVLSPKSKENLGETRGKALHLHEAPAEFKAQTSKKVLSPKAMNGLIPPWRSPRAATARPGGQTKGIVTHLTEFDE